MRQRVLEYQADALVLLSPLLALPRPVLLHSADRSNRFGRYDILAAAPTTPITFAQGTLTIGARTLATQQPLEQLGLLLESRRCPERSGPFRSGFLGYFGYELHQYLEHQRPAPASPAPVPELWGGLYNWSIVTDHRHATTILYSPDPETEAKVLSYLNAPQRDPGAFELAAFEPSLSDAAYQRTFVQAQVFLHAGDCYQVNVARHFTAPFKGDPLALYRYWLSKQPAPFAAYLGLATDTAVLSLSPERFVQLRGQQVSVSPIKGTRGRCPTTDQDNLARLDLLSSAKERAENLMIVDLLRNDLGRVSKPGTVHVTHLFEPITFANVHHLVSTIESQLLAGTGPMEVVRALFPCGSVTGAPKIRAIDIINELEPVGRSVYCGSIGYIDDSGAMDMSVAIRTAVASPGRVHLWGGGALVSDSQAAREQQEIYEKIGRLLN